VLIHTILILGLAATGLAALIRMAPWWPPAALARKPLSCVICMGAWCALAVGALAVAADIIALPRILPGLFVWLASSGVAAFLLAQTGLFTDASLFSPHGE
jgi:hypothetical protein